MSEITFPNVTNKYICLYFSQRIPIPGISPIYLVDPQEDGIADSASYSILRGPSHKMGIPISDVLWV